MAKLVTYALLTELKNFRHCVDASELGLPPGHWPEKLEVDPSFGNGLALTQVTVLRDRDVELLAVEYRQIGGVLRVLVFND